MVQLIQFRCVETMYQHTPSSSLRPESHSRKADSEQDVARLPPFLWCTKNSTMIALWCFPSPTCLGYFLKVSIASINIWKLPATADMFHKRPISTFPFLTLKPLWLAHESTEKIGTIFKIKYSSSFQNKTKFKFVQWVIQNPIASKYD